MRANVSLNSCTHMTTRCIVVSSVLHLHAQVALMPCHRVAMVSPKILEGFPSQTTRMSSWRKNTCV